MGTPRQTKMELRFHYIYIYMLFFCYDLAKERPLNIRVGNMKNIYRCVIVKAMAFANRYYKTFKRHFNISILDGLSFLTLVTIIPTKNSRLPLFSSELVRPRMIEKLWPTNDLQCIAAAGCMCGSVLSTIACWLPNGTDAQPIACYAGSIWQNGGGYWCHPGRTAKKSIAMSRRKLKGNILRYISTSSSDMFSCLNQFLKMSSSSASTILEEWYKPCVLYSKKLRMLLFKNSTISLSAKTLNLSIESTNINPPILTRLRFPHSRDIKKKYNNY